MSRNLRHRATPPPAQKMPQGGNHSQESSDDDDYGGVDQISDSEEDEPDVEVAEERAIIESEDDMQDTPRPLIDDGQVWEGFEFDDQNEILGQDIPFFDQEFQPDEPPPRRVRFKNVSDSEISDDEEDDDPLYPDIFITKNELDPGFRREIDQDDDNLSNGSYYDYQGEGDVMEYEDEADNSDGSESGSSSGYETDEGETTDEDLPPAAKYLPAKSLLRRSADASSDEEEMTISRRQPIRQPRLSTFIHDGSKPYGVIHTGTNRMIMYNVENVQVRRFSVDGTPARTTFQQVAPIVESSPMISNSGNIMMSAMNSWNDPFTYENLGGQVLGPPEAFYPFMSVNADGTVAQDSSSGYDEDDLDDEDLWNVDDFLQFGEESSADENEDVPSDETCAPASTPGCPSSTPARPTTARSEDQVHPLLDHFEKHGVAAFRSNQNRHQLLNRNIASRDSLAFGGSLLEGTIRGVKSGRLHHANTPITPVRKHKSTIRPPLAVSPGSPLSQLSRKRRYDGEDYHGHKRNKSLI